MTACILGVALLTAVLNPDAPTALTPDFHTSSDVALTPSSLFFLSMTSLMALAKFVSAVGEAAYVFQAAASTWLTQKLAAALALSTQFLLAISGVLIDLGMFKLTSYFPYFLFIFVYVEQLL
jgi:hypothetical protein